MEQVQLQVIILAAGYATRLFPLTENNPKSLLPVANRPIIEHIIKKIEQVNEIKNIYIVTNNRFEQHFKKWLSNSVWEKPIEIINDGTTSNEDRLGALGDFFYVVNLKNIDSAIMVIAGDNIFEESLVYPFNLFKKRVNNIILLHDVKDLELAKNYGVVEVDKDNLLIHFEEKPVSPKSTLVSTGIYIFQKKTIPLIKKYIDQGNNMDKLGNFIEWLHKRESVYCYITSKGWYDIGDIKQLENARMHYKEKA